MKQGVFSQPQILLGKKNKKLTETHRLWRYFPLSQDVRMMNPRSRVALMLINFDHLFGTLGAKGVCVFS